jgi:hypothetical protein
MTFRRIHFGSMTFVAWELDWGGQALVLGAGRLERRGAGKQAHGCDEHELSSTIEKGEARVAARGMKERDWARRC